MKLVGLTGGIASGKSTVARMLVELGAELIDADVLAREIVDPGRPAYRDILEYFGEDVLDEDKSINRDALAQIVFNDEQARGKLNSFTHPRVGEELVGRLQYYRDKGADIVIFDAALLLETPAVNWIKPVIVVTADDETKIERLKLRNGYEREEALSRITSQWSDKERSEKAHYVIDNSGSLQELRERVQEVWDRLARE